LGKVARLSCSNLLCYITKYFKDLNIRIKTVQYFPKTVRAIGAVFGLFGLVMIWETPVIGLLFLFVTAVIFSTHHGFEINLEPNYFRDYVWVLGWMDGNKSNFKKVEFLFLQIGKHSFLTYSLKEKEVAAFEGYLKLEGRNEVHFLTDVNKERLILKMERLASRLQVAIMDYSNGNPVRIFEPDQMNQK
jgi:hypothetical protein